MLYVIVYATVDFYYFFSQAALKRRSKELAENIAPDPPVSQPSNADDITSDEDVFVLTPKKVKGRKVKKLSSSGDETVDEVDQCDTPTVQNDSVSPALQLDAPGVGSTGNSAAPSRPSSPTTSTGKPATPKVGGKCPSPRKSSSASLDSNPSTTEYIFRGPKKSSDILCWLEEEFLRRKVPRAYRFV